MAGPDRLEGSPQQPHNIRPSKPAPHNQQPSKKTSGDGHHTDAVEISREGSEYQQLLKRIDQVPDIRPDRLERIQQALKDGTYHIDSDILTNRIIQELLIDEAASNSSSDLPQDVPPFS